MIFFVFRVNRYISMMKALWPLLWKERAREPTLVKIRDDLREASWILIASYLILDQSITGVKSGLSGFLQLR